MARNFLIASVIGAILGCGSDNNRSNSDNTSLTREIMIELNAWLSGAMRSATMWFNSVFAVATTVIAELPAVLPELASVLPPDVYKYLLFLNILGNMALRVKTRLPLTAK